MHENYNNLLGLYYINILIYQTAEKNISSLQVQLRGANCLIFLKEKIDPFQLITNY